MRVHGGLLQGLQGLITGQQLLLITWLHHARRDQLYGTAGTGVFSSQSTHRPNPLGLYTVSILSIGSTGVTEGQFCGIAGTPVLDIRPS